MTYTTGRVYRIICLSNPDIQYIGSTFDTLRNRLQVHKQACKSENSIGFSLYEYVRKDPLGWNNYKMILIKEYLVYRDNVKDSKHLHAYEQLWINKLKCVNKINAFVPKCVKDFNSKKYSKEYNQNNQEKNKENKKEYRNNNQEKIKEYTKEYYQNNQEKIKEYRNNNQEKIKENKKEYRNNNQEKIKENKKEYYQNNQEKIKEKLKEKIICECGSTITKAGLSQHNKTLKHTTFINSK